MITAYVIKQDSCSAPYKNLLVDGVGVDPMGCLFLVHKKNEHGGIAEGEIIAPGHWERVIIETEPEVSDTL